MRIGLAIETDRPGGAETMMLELARALRARGHEIVALGPSGKGGWLTARFGEMGVERHLVHLRGPFGIGAVADIATILKEHHVDVLHSHEFRMAVCGALAAKMAGCRHVITLHGRAYYASKLRRRLAFRVASALSHHTVAVSSALREAISHSLHMPERSIAVVHNGVAPRSGSGRDVRSELGLGTESILLLAVGNLTRVKGHDVLMRALARLRSEDTRLVVAIAGAGDEQGRLESLARDLGIERAVCLLGFRSDVPDLLAAADVYVMPSLSEGLPMAMIEAMLAGKPVVASNAGGISELVNGPDVGRLVPPNDAQALAARLSEVVADPDLRERLGAAGRERALASFTADAMAARYLAMYAQ